MKKIIFVSIFLVLSMFGRTQTKYYISGGISVSNSISTKTIEAGIYNEKTWYSLSLSTYKDGNTEYYYSFKNYIKFFKSGIVDNYYFTSFNMLSSDYSISIEPGLAAVFNISKKIAPQFSVSFPIYENKKLFSNQAISFGVGLNYWIN